MTSIIIKLILHFTRTMLWIQKEVSKLISSAHFEFTDSWSFIEADCKRVFILQTKDSFNFPLYHLFFQLVVVDKSWKQLKNLTLGL